MKKSDFWFDLPDELIAQTPIEHRERSRLLFLGKSTGEISHRHFYELADILREGDCLVMNDSRVMPARLLGSKETGGAAEIVLLRDLGEGVWECLARPGRRINSGVKLVFGNGELTATVTETTDIGNKLICFNYDGVFLEILERLGKMPLPPYIHEDLADSERYQTVYSRSYGSAAAPTAGLHFTMELLERLDACGVSLCYITLHVGLGTFRPVKTDDISDHEMHEEYFTIARETADEINRAKASGGRVIAVGTTSCRALESCADQRPSDAGYQGSTNVIPGIKPFSGFTDIFIYPGYEFKFIDGLITNFHLPESTLIMLVSALAGRENVLRAYQEAIRERYRFYSFGDACMVL